MTDPPLPRIYFVFAAEAPVAVIIRRGPTKSFHIMKWNTRTDTIERGALFKGRIYEEGCDVSPDGKHFIYFAAQFQRQYADGHTAAWTAVSKPPWLTALTLWPQSDTWGGNAYFADNDRVVIDCSHWEELRCHPKHPQGKIEAIPRWIGTDAPEQPALPGKPSKFAYFDGHEGRDHHGRPFWLENGCLLRESHDGKRQIIDFTTMTPEPARSPDWARRW